MQNHKKILHFNIPPQNTNLLGGGLPVGTDFKVRSSVDKKKKKNQMVTGAKGNIQNAPTTHN